MKPKGDGEDTSSEVAERANRRPHRTTEDLKAMVEAVLVAELAAQRSRASPSFPIDEKDDLWWILHDFEDGDLVSDVEAERRALDCDAALRAAWNRLVEFARLFTDQEQTDEMRQVLDDIEAERVTAVVAASADKAAAMFAWARVMVVSPSDANRRRQEAARALHTMFPEHNSLQLADMILESIKLDPPPCPRFVQKYLDNYDRWNGDTTDEPPAEPRHAIATWLRQRVRDRRL